MAAEPARPYTPKMAVISTRSDAGDSRALYVLLLVVFLNIAGFGLVLPLLPFYALAFKISPAMIGVLFSAFSVGQFIGEPFWGRLSDRIGRRPVLLITIFANALSYAAFAFAPNFVAAVGIRLVSGFLAGNNSTIQGYIADITPPARRAGRLGLLGSAFSLGFVTGPGIGGLLAHPSEGTAGFHLPLLAAAGFGLASAAGVLLFVRETRAPARTAAEPARQTGALAVALRHPLISRILAVSLIIIAGFSGVEATFGLWSQSRFDWGPQQIGFCFMTTGAIAAFTQAIVTGRLVRRFGEIVTLTGGLSLIVAGMLTQGLSPTWHVAVAGFMLVALGQSLTFPNIAALISKATAPDRQGEMLGLNMSTGALARIVGPLIATPLFGVAAALPFLSGATLVAGALWITAQVGRRMKTAI